VLLRHLAVRVGEGDLGVLDAPTDCVLTEARVDTRQVRCVVAPEAEDGVAIVAVVTLERVLARHHLGVEVVGVGQGSELAVRVERQPEQQHQRR
jgi:hypothetical protein